MDTHIIPDGTFTDGEALPSAALHSAAMRGEPGGERVSVPETASLRAESQARLGLTTEGKSLPTARLPGEPDPETIAATGAEALRTVRRLVEPGAPARLRRRQRLLMSVAVLVLVVAATGAFVVSPYNHVVPVPSGMVSAVRNLEVRAGLVKYPPFSPAASLANVNLPPQPASVVQPAFHPQPASEQLAQLMLLGRQAGAFGGASPAIPNRGSTLRSAGAAPIRHPTVGQLAGAQGGGPSPSGGHPAAAPVAPQAASGPPPGYVPHEPGAALTASLAPPQGSPPAAAPPRASGQVTAAKAVEPSSGSGSAAAGSTRLAALGHPMTVASVAPLAASALPQHPHPLLAHPPIAGALDPVAVAAKLQAAPMTPVEQVKVLEVVTEIAAMVRAERTAVADLRAQVGKLSTGTNAKLVDFERRLALVEAESGIAAAAAAGRPPSPPASDVAAVTASPSPPHAAQGGAPPAGNSSAARVRYRLQAASPGLAMLAEIDKSGGEGAQLEVQVGDTIPGYGRVVSVSQQGTAWVVTTEHGTIR